MLPRFRELPALGTFTARFGEDQASRARLPKLEAEHCRWVINMSWMLMLFEQSFNGSKLPERQQRLEPRGVNYFQDLIEDQVWGATQGDNASRQQSNH